MEKLTISAKTGFGSSVKIQKLNFDYFNRLTGEQLYQQLVNLVEENNTGKTLNKEKALMFRAQYDF